MHDQQNIKIYETVLSFGAPPCVTSLARTTNMHTMFLCVSQ